MNDTRDLRDPQHLGNYLLSLKSPGFSLRYMYDRSEGVHLMPDYRHDELLSTETAAAYKAELEARAAAGDKYAKSMLAGEGPIDDGD